MFIDSYTLKWKLTNGGETWEEKHDNLSLSDFEVVYGNNAFHILEISLKLKSEVDTK